MASTIRLPQGRLIYVGQTDSLYQLDFKTLKAKKIFELPMSGSIKHLSLIDHRDLLFHAFLAKETPNNFIMELNLNTFKTGKVREGYGPKYMPMHQSFFFYDTAIDSGPSLYSASLQKPFERGGRIIQTSGAVDSDTVIPVSENKIVFIAKDSSNSNAILQYDLRSRALKKLSIQNCTMPKLWRDETNQLLCFDREKYKCFLTDLDGKNVRYIDAVYPVVSIPETDQMVISVPYVRFFVEHHGLYLYDFKTGETREIVNDSGAGLGDAVYLPD